MNLEWKKIPSSEIDDQAWDACVAQNNGAIFSLSWYWRAVLPNWHGWVKGDYNAVMTDALVKKWGIINSNKTPLYVKYLECLGQNLHQEEQKKCFKK